MDNINELLTGIMEKAGITQKQVSMILGYSHSTVSNWKNGYIIPTPYAIAKLKELYCLSADEIRDRVNAANGHSKPVVPKSKTKFVLSSLTNLSTYPMVKINGKLYCLLDKCEWRRYGYCLVRGCMKRKVRLPKEERHDQRNAGTISEPMQRG